MSHRRSSQDTGFVECIKRGDLQGVQRCLLWNGKVDKLLLNKKFEQHEETALHFAVKHQHESIVEWLLQNEADIHATDLYLRTPLHTACVESEDGHTNIIELLLKCKGVNVNARDENGITPITLVAEKGNSSAVRLLIDKGADITLADKTDNTTLHAAAEKGQPEVLELLLKELENKGIIGKQNKSKDTPLHLAVTSKCPQCVALLLNAGAASTVEVENKLGQTVTDLAKDQGNKKIISLLENPQKAKEVQMKPRSANKVPVLGRHASVLSDSSANYSSLYQLNPTGATRAPELPFSQNDSPVQVNLTVHQYNTKIQGGSVALGPGAQVVNTQDATAVGPPRSVPSGDSHYNLNVNDGMVAVGDYSRINLAPGTPGTPSTAGSSDVPFFTEPQENGYVSSGFPTENPSSLGATESATRPNESPGDKLEESSRRPFQEEFPGDKVNESSRHPVQEEHPTDSSDVSLLSLPIKEQYTTDKSHISSARPVQKESPREELNESSCHPVQEEHSTDSLDVSSLSRPVQEQCPTDKSQVPSTSPPVQEESSAGKSNVLLPYSVPEENSSRKLVGAVNSSHAGELCTSRHPMSNQTKNDHDLSLASDYKFTGEAHLGSSFSGEPAVERIVLTKHTNAVKKPATGTFESAKDSSAEEAMASSDAVETEDRRIAIDSESCDKAGALQAALFASAVKHDEASEQNWQGNVGSGAPRRASPMTRAVPKVAQDRLLKESKSLANEMFNLDHLCGPVESQLKLSGKNGNRDVALPRVGLEKSSGTSSLVKTPEEPKSAVQPSNRVTVPKSTAPSNAADAGPSCAPSPSCSKVSPHRKAQHSREDAIPDNILPTGAVANVNQSMRNACNGEVSRPGNDHGDNPVGTSLDNLSSGSRSPADGHSMAIVIEDDYPENDRKGHENCEDRCRLM